MNSCNYVLVNPAISPRGRWPSSVDVHSITTTTQSKTKGLFCNSCTAWISLTICNTLLHAHVIAITSLGARWSLKSPASRLFTQPFIQGVDQRKYQSSASLAFVGGIHRWSVNSTHKGSVTWKIFPFDDVIMVAMHKHVKGTHLLWNM